MLDKNDISVVYGVITKKEILNEITRAEFENILHLGSYFRDKYVLVEEDVNEDREEQFKYAKVGESKTKYYYVSVDGEAFTIDKRSNRKFVLKPIYCSRRNTVKIKINNRVLCVKKLVAYNFIKGTKENDIIYHKDGNIYNCAANNLIVVSNNDHLKKIAGTGLAKPVGLYENDKLIKTWTSGLKCSKDLYCSYDCIYSICNGITKNKMFDVRWINDQQCK